MSIFYEIFDRFAVYVDLLDLCVTQLGNYGFSTREDRWMLQPRGLL